MENRQNIKAIILDSNLDIAERIKRLEDNYTYDELNTIKVGKWNWNIVTYASRHGDIAILNYLINRFKTLLDPKVNETGGSILHHAAARNSYEVFQFLWENFPQFREVEDFRDYSLIHYACANDNTTVVKFLYQMQPKTFDKKSVFGHMPIHLAAQLGNPETIRTLAKYYQKSENVGQYLDNLFAGEDNPLHYTVRSNRVDNLKCLLALGMSLEKANVNGLLPVHLAAKHGSLDILKYLNSQKRVDLQCVTHNTYKVQPLHFAVLYNHLPIVKWFVKQGIDIFESTLSGNKLIHLAAYKRNITLMKWLVEKGMAYDSPNSELRTILHIISDSCKLIALKELEAYPFNYLSYDSEGYSPFHNACRNISHYTKRIMLAFIGETIMKEPVSWFPSKEVKMYSTNFWDDDELIEIIEDFFITYRIDNNAGRKEVVKNNFEGNDDPNEIELHYEKLLNFFISKGSLLDQRTNNEAGDSAMHIAAEFDNVDMLKALAKKNLPLHSLNAKKQSPIELAVGNGSLKALNYLLEQMHHLLTSHEWHQLLCIAIANHKYYTLNILLKKQTLYYAASSAQLHQRNEYGLYPQHVLTDTLSNFTQAKSQVVIRILKFLIFQHGIDINYQTSEGKTLLNLFCSLKFSEFSDLQPILKFLLNSGSYPYFPTEKNTLPFDQLIQNVGYSPENFKLLSNFMQEYGIRTGALPQFFSTITADEKSINRYMKYYPNYYSAELVNKESQPNFLKKALNKKNMAEIKLLLRFGFAIGYHFTEAEWHLLNNHPELDLFLAVGAKLITEQGYIDLETVNEQSIKAIYKVEDINLPTLGIKTKLNWARLIKVILVNSSAFNFTEKQFNTLLDIFLLLISNLPGMQVKILNLVRTTIDELQLYPDKSANMLLRNQYLLKLLYQFYNSFHFKHLKIFPKLSYLCVNSLLLAEDFEVVEPADKAYIKNGLELCTENNNEVKRKLWCLFEKFSLFPTQPITGTFENNSNTNATSEPKLSK